MSKFLIFAVAASFALAMPEAGYAAEREKATYVGDGRYAGEGTRLITQCCANVAMNTQNVKWIVSETKSAMNVLSV